MSKKIVSFMSKGFGRNLYLVIERMLRNMPDEKYIKLVYRIRIGNKLNLDSPQLYSEKLQWLKLHDRRPEYTQMVDKYEAKKYIASQIGEEYVIPTIGVWKTFDEIDFSDFPEQFVLKCTHDSGGLVICKNKAVFDAASARKKIEKSLKRNFYWHSREYPYKNVEPRIIAEPFMIEDESGWLTDYKFFCFDGQPKIVYVSKDKAENPTTDFFDMDFNQVPMRMRDPNSEVLPSKPENFEEMKRIAGVLSAGIPHLRADFYEIKGRLYVGELTFYHCSGFVEIHPKEWSYKMGEWISLENMIQCKG